MSPKISPHLPAQIIAEFAPTAAAQPAASRARTPKLGGNGLPGLLARKAERQQTRQAQPAEPAAQLLHELPSDVLEIIAQKLKTANPKNLAPLKAVNKPLRDVANAVLAADNSVQLSVDMTHIDSQQKFAQIVATAGRLNAHKLSLSGLVTQIDLAALAELPQLRELDLCGITHLNGQHLNGIEKLDQLQSLSIYYPARLNDQDLEKLPRGLKNLYLSRCNNITGASLAGMPCLEKLQIENCAAVNDAAVEGLASSAASLTHLSLANCTAITGVGLGALKNLQKLNAHNCFFLHDAGLQAISENCPTLTWLKLRDCHRISGQVDLRPLKQLQYLSLAATHSCFIDTTKLPVGVTHLDLRQSGFVADHFAGHNRFAAFKQLQSLDLGGSEDCTLEELGQLPASLNLLGVEGHDSDQLIELVDGSPAWFEKPRTICIGNTAVSDDLRALMRVANFKILEQMPDLPAHLQFDPAPARSQ